MSFGDLELHGHSGFCFLGVNWSGPGTSSTTNHIFFRALGWLHGPRCKQPLSYNYWKCMFVGFVTRCTERHVTYEVLPIVFGIECRVGTTFENVVQPLLTCVLFFWCFSIGPHQTTYQSNIHVRLRNRVTSNTYAICSYGYWRCTFVDSSIEYVCSSNCVHYWIQSSYYVLKT